VYYQAKGNSGEHTDHAHFTRIRQVLSDNTELRLEIEKIKNKLDNQDKNMEVIFRYLDELIEKRDNPPPRKRIGFKSDNL
jgi:regulator of replication initiation timing